MNIRYNMQYSNLQTHSLSDEKSTGVKEQNLFLDGATLQINENLTVENLLECRSLTALEGVSSSCDVFIQGDLQAKQTQLNETVLDGDFTISCQANSIPVFQNISDPKSQRDAITFNYFSNTSPQAYTCFSEIYKDANQGKFTSSIVDIRSASNNTENYTPKYAEIFDPQKDRMLLKKPGIYQVSYQLLRGEGSHDGNNFSNLFLRLTTNNNTSILCTGDTRGHHNTEATTTSLYAIFSLPSIPSSIPTYISVYTSAYVMASYSTISVIWFPFNQSYDEVD